MARRKETDAVDDKLTQEDPIPMDQLGQSKPIEQAVEGDVNLAAFMEEELEIIIHSKGLEGENPVPMPCCNEINMPIVREKPTIVKRKYVEILARCRVTDYDQATHDPSKPENIQMVPRTSLFYPFSVISDPNSLGREWLNQILAQPS